MFSIVILYGIIVLTIYLALMYNSEALMLLVFTEAAFFIVSLVFITFRKCTMKVNIQVPIRITETYKENLIKIVVSNESVVPVTRMKVLVIVKNSVTKKRKRWMKLAETYDKESVFIQSLIFPTSGNYEIILKKIKIYDVTGLMYGTIKADCWEQIQVLPRMHDVQVQLTSAVRNFYGDSEVYDAYQSGYDNSELFDVRDYRSGDRLQAVHWKMTAKQGELMVKEPSLPKVCPVVFLLDYGDKGYGKYKDSVACFVEIVSSLSFSMLNAGCPHYVVWFDQLTEDVTRVRIEDEETLFSFINLLMNLKWTKGSERIVERYQEKYKAESYVRMLLLNEKLELKRDGEVVAQISEEGVQEALRQMELLL